MTSQTDKHDDFTLFTIYTCVKRKWWKIALLTIVLFGLCFPLTSNLPVYYRSDDVTIYEMQTSYSQKGLHTIGTFLGYELGEIAYSSDAIQIDQFIEKLNSTEMLKRILQLSVTTKSGRHMDYYTYLQKHPQLPFRNVPILRTLMSDKPKHDTLAYINDALPRALTAYEDSIFRLAKTHIQYVSSKNLNYVSVLDEDPYVCASLASAIQQMYKEYMTEYRVGKNKMDSAYYAAQTDSAYQRYLKASAASVNFHNMHGGELQPSLEQKQKELDDAADLYYKQYVGVYVQQMQSAALIQDHTPASYPFNPSSVPNKPVGTKRGYILAMSFLLALVSSLIVFMRKEIIAQLV